MLILFHISYWYLKKPLNPGTMILLSLVFLRWENEGLPQQKCQVNRSYQARQMNLKWINVLTWGGKFRTWTLLMVFGLLPNMQELGVGLSMRHLLVFFFQGRDWNSRTGLFSHPVEYLLPRGEIDWFMLFVVLTP